MAQPRSGSSRRLTLEERVQDYLRLRNAFYRHGDLRELETRLMKRPRQVKADGKRFLEATAALLRYVSRYKGKASPLTRRLQRWRKAVLASQSMGRPINKETWSRDDFKRSVERANRGIVLTARLRAAERALFEHFEMQPARRDPLRISGTWQKQP